MAAPLWSISIICKNEEKSIPNLIKSLQEYITRGGEIFLVDTGSTDSTIETIKKLGFQNVTECDVSHKLRYELVEDKFKIDLDDRIDEINAYFIVGEDKKFEKTGKSIFNFGAARKYADEQCSYAWVLSLDCDEVCTVLNIDAINSIISTYETQQLSFVFRYNASSITSRDKFYNKNYGEWRWIVHEQVKPIKGKKVTLYSLSSDILLVDHFQHDADHRANYVLGMCMNIMEGNASDQHLFWLARDMIYMENKNMSVINLLKRYLKQYPSSYPGERCMVCLLIGDAYLKMGGGKNINKGLAWYFKGSIYGQNKYREPFWKLMKFFFSNKNFISAIQYARAALEIKENTKEYFTDSSCYGHQIYTILYISLYSVGDRTEAYNIWETANKIFPNNTEISNHKIIFSC